MNEAQTNEFVKAVSKADKDDVSLPKSIQKNIANQIIGSDSDPNSGMAAKEIKKEVDKAVNDFHFSDKMDEEKTKKKADRTRIKFDTFVDDLSEETHVMLEKIKVLHDFLPEFKNATKDNIVIRSILMKRLNRVQDSISNLIDDFKGE
jgi:hypothetical protein